MKSYVTLIAALALVGCQPSPQVAPNGAADDLLSADELAKTVRSADDANRKDSNGWTLLMRYAQKGDLKAITHLGNLGADGSVADRTGLTALDISLLEGNEACSLEILRHLSDINHKDQQGSTYLSKALFSRQFLVASMLLDMNALADGLSSGNISPLYYCLRDDSVPLPLATRVGERVTKIPPMPSKKTAEDVARSGGRRALLAAVKSRLESQN